ncbi:MAG: hypothetical protein CMO01_33155 [Thalassobius sp.]|nr:hypothetical protein [Thalassovita sp.]
MKKLIFTLLTLAFTYAVVLAQDNAYEAAVLENVQILDTAVTEATFLTMANNFERIALAEKDKWLPYYYAAFSKINQAMVTKDINDIDVLAQKANKYLEVADSLSPNNSEILCLKALSYSSRIKVDVMGRGMKFVSKSNSYLKEACAIDKNNPRAYYLLAQNLYNVPADFGGGPEAAKRLFDNSARLFAENIADENTIKPHWGRAPLEHALGRYKDQVEED